LEYGILFGSNLNSAKFRPLQFCGIPCPFFTPNFDLERGIWGEIWEEIQSERKRTKYRGGVEGDK
jgi:hypothetical protein